MNPEDVKQIVEATEKIAQLSEEAGVCYQRANQLEIKIADLQDRLNAILEKYATNGNPQT